jgi:hypothetical protein
VKRLQSVLLVALLACLPSVDVVWCPDGCADTDCLHFSVNGESSSDADSCGLCLNGVAVGRDILMPSPVEQSLAVQPRLDPAPVLVAPRQLDRPPRF